MTAKIAPALDVARLAAVSNRPLDSRRRSRLQHFENHARRGWPDVRDLAQRAVRLEQRLDRLVEVANSRGGACVAPTALLRRLHRREIAQ